MELRLSLPTHSNPHTMDREERIGRTIIAVGTAAVALIACVGAALCPVFPLRFLQPGFALDETLPFSCTLD